MLESSINSEYLYKREPSLKDLLRTGETDLSTIINDALSDLIMAVAHKDGVDVRLLCTRLPLTEDTYSDEDVVLRSRINVVISVLGTNAKLSVTGKNSASGTEETITLYSDTGASATSKSLALGTNSFYFMKLYKYYKYSIDVASTVTDAYLVERTFENLHLLLSLSYAYKKLSQIHGDVYSDKSDYYYSQFEKALSEINYVVDIDEDDVISDSDEVNKGNVTRILL